MGYMGSYYNIPKAIFYLLKGDYGLIGVERVGDALCRFPIAPLEKRCATEGVISIFHPMSHSALWNSNQKPCRKLEFPNVFDETDLCFAVHAGTLPQASCWVVAAKLYVVHPKHF